MSSPASIHRKPHWYRSVPFNSLVIGLVGFCAPGLWNAMSSLGAGGQQSPFLVNAASSLVFALMGIFCVFGSVVASKIGYTATLALGTVGFPVYSAGLYLNNRYGVEWLVLFGAATCGISAGLFWSIEGAIALGYSRPEKRGKYLNVWLIFRTLGPLVGGAIVLALNSSDSQKASGKIGYQTYLIFVALQCLGTPLALFLTPPAKVERADGSRVKVLAPGTFWEEIKGVFRVSARRHILLLLPLFWSAYFNQYSGNFQVYYFGVRARALMGFVGNFSNIAASTAMSLLLDWNRFTVKTRLKIGFYVCVVLHVIGWVYGWVIQEKYTANPPMLDWESEGFVEGFFVILLWNISFQALANWMYYLVSTMSDNITDINRLTGILRGQESLAQAVSFGLNTREWYGGRVPLAVNTILLGLAVIPTWIVVHEHEPVTETPQEEEEIGQDEPTSSAATVALPEEEKSVEKIA
ncbi:major facilitator superfamily domain-containing protein [Gongronella butleri]|nr:major facilitator superfamily domain-containing protein [Gongronella butleri]